MILRYENTKSQEEKEKKEQNGFPHLPQFPVPMLPEHYHVLSDNHKNQIIWTYVPHMRETVEDFHEILALSPEERLKAYEKMVLGHSREFATTLAKIKLRDSNPRKTSHYPQKDLARIIDFVDGNEAIKAEDLVGAVSPRVFSRLMLYIKFSGNNQASIRKFFEGLMRE